MYNKDKKKKNPATELRKLSEGLITLEESKKMDNKLVVLENIQQTEEENSRSNLPTQEWENLYPILCSEAILTLAYSNIRSNLGSTTKGTDKKSIDGLSEREILRTSEQLKSDSYEILPVREVMIPKPGKTEKRPLGIPTFNNRIVGEAVRLILNAIYEPHFETQNSNHGFRQKKSVHTLLKNIDYELRGSQYVIEGDIKGAFPSLDHKIIIAILRKKIKDEKFLNLIKKFLKSGLITEEGQRRDTLSGVPQGQLFSPILWNIYMHDFDTFVTGELTQFVDTEFNNTPQREKTKTPRAYQSLTFKSQNNDRKVSRLKKMIDKPIREYTHDQLKELRNLEASAKTFNLQRRNIPSIIRSTKKIKIIYKRYADDWILATNATLPQTQILKEKIASWLMTKRKLTLSSEKTKITDIHKEPIKFLGFSILNKQTLVKRVEKSKYPVRVTCPATIEPDWDRVLSRLQYNGYLELRPQQEICKNKNLSKWLPKEKSGYSELNPDVIFTKYNSIFVGLINYYYPLCSIKSKLQTFEYILKFSLLKTLSQKYKTTLYKQYLHSKKITKKHKLPPQTICREEMIEGKPSILKFYTFKEYCARKKRP